MKKKCPLCKSLKTFLFEEMENKKYFICRVCDLVFLPRKYHLSPNEEKKRYDLHENDPSDEDYRNFLSRLAKPIKEMVKLPARGLDYGSGPVPVLANMLEEESYEMKIYDPYYAKNDSIFNVNYDFICCSEVFEHFANPGDQIEKLLNILRVNGILGIMTDIRQESTKFTNWHYRRDPTHVCFYSDNTMNWISEDYDLTRFKISKRVNIFQKK
jgi:SAM-dependent methyltransferase